MVCFTFTALVGLLASAVFAAPAAPVSPKFRIQTVYNSGNQSFGNLWLTTYHTGAGLNSVIGVKNKQDGALFSLTDGYLVFELNGQPKYYFTWRLEYSRPQYQDFDNQGRPQGYVYSAPKQYLLISDNIQSKPSGDKGRQGYFSTGDFKGVRPLQFTRTANTPWSTFSICHVKGLTLEGTRGNQVLWRKIGSVGDKSGQCGDVGFRAHYV